MAWLLIPSKKEYNEIDITTTAAASVHPTLQGKSNTELGQETLEGAVVKKFALNNEDGQPSTFVWVSESGIILKLTFHKMTPQVVPKQVFILKMWSLAHKTPLFLNYPTVILKRKTKVQHCF
ncbi:MAG: hypothetical protein IPI79_10385 [Moraxellaceae bacterium]|nr:hypothetical protein [Moraxellaceae bacterium]